MAVDAIGLGRDAFQRHAWAEAMEAFTAADQEGSLAPEDLELLADAAWWSGKPDEATEALERAFGAHADAGRTADAARMALLLAYRAFRRLDQTVGGGWIAQAERLLKDAPESVSHAWLEIFQVVLALLESRLAETIDHADRAMELARRHGSADVYSLALSLKGLAEVAGGDWQIGLSHVDEAAASAMSGELDPRVASDIWCQTMAACRDVGDLKRAGQWADEAERWMRRESLGGYPGICRVHRAELKMLRGKWPEAEQEARQACEELERFQIMDGLGFAHYQVGEVRLRMGDLAGATEEFERAYEFGHDAQPGLALLQLARGEADDAARSIARALATHAGTEGHADRTARARLLPAQVEIAVARGDMETARSAVAELEAISSDFGRPVFEAGLLTAQGELFLRDEKAPDASSTLERAWRLWQQIELPYESARSRLLYARAVAAEGDQVTANRDMRAARGVFERLGASLEMQRVDTMMGASELASPTDRRRAVMTFMFTDIVTSTDLVSLIGDAAWEELLLWHDRELRAAFSRHRGEEVNSTGDGFFVAFAQAADGVECAVDIQRRLTRHRSEHGFAPQVRIGLHAAEATRRAGDYTGKGVHVAARVGAAATGDEILVSSTVVAAAGSNRFVLSEPRTLTLKGVAEPIEARSVEWRSPAN